MHSTWPDLKYEAWRDTCQTLHLWTQIIGKVRLSKSPWTNHAWHSVLYVTERGLTTSVIHDLDFSFSLELDFIDHALLIRRSDGKFASLPLRPESVSSFYERCLGALKTLNIKVVINEMPNELPEATRFSEDRQHQSYDPESVRRFHQVLLSCDRVMKQFRSHFTGKCSPVHFFWGSFDMAVSRFSGRLAPEHPGGVPHLPNTVAREAYSHEVSSAGFWPGNDRFPTAAFYSYAYPMPEGFDQAEVPPGAYYDKTLREFILPYDVVRNSDNPDSLVMSFFESTYKAAANLGRWDRKALEESPYLRTLQAQQRAA